MRIEYQQLSKMLQVLNPQTNKKVELVTILTHDTAFAASEVRVVDGIIYARSVDFDNKWLICPKTEITAIQVKFAYEADPTEILAPLRAIA